MIDLSVSSHGYNKLLIHKEEGRGSTRLLLGCCTFENHNAAGFHSRYSSLGGLGRCCEAASQVHHSSGIYPLLLECRACLRLRNDADKCRRRSIKNKIQKLPLTIKED